MKPRDNHQEFINQSSAHFLVASSIVKKHVAKESFSCEFIIFKVNIHHFQWKSLLFSAKSIMFSAKSMIC